MPTPPEEAYRHSRSWFLTEVAERLTGSNGPLAGQRCVQAAVATTACKFQDDPHNQKITHSAFEEYAQKGAAGRLPNF